MSNGYYKDHVFVFCLWYKTGAQEEARVIAKFDHEAWPKLAVGRDFSDVTSVTLSTVEKL